MIERLKKRIGLLGTGQRNLAIDDEERYTLYSKTANKVSSLLDCIHSFNAFQHGFGPLPIQASFGNNIDERLPIADIPALCEVSPKQRLHNCIRHALFLGQPDEPVGVQGVRRSFDSAKVETDAFVLSDCNHLGIEFQRPLPTTNGRAFRGFGSTANKSYYTPLAGSAEEKSV